jgi:hypothetical protein
MRKLALLVVVIAACSKGNDRPQMCKVALDTLVAGLEDQVKIQKDPTIKGKFQDVIKRARDKFPAYCESASEEDIDCLSRGAPALSDPKCKHAVDGMKTVFALE